MTPLHLRVNILRISMIGSQSARVNGQAWENGVQLI